jgi:hypothetical protein
MSPACEPAPPAPQVAPPISLAAILRLSRYLWLCFSRALRVRQIGDELGENGEADLTVKARAVIRQRNKVPRRSAQ